MDLYLAAPGPNAHQLTTIRILGAASFAARFRPRVLSTTLALARVPAGRRAGYVTEGDLRDSVHFASGIAVSQPAGCVATGLNGQPLHTSRSRLVATADLDTHAALVSIIEELQANRK